MTSELIATIFYGLLSIAGGIIGYVKSKSTVSLISGGISGLGVANFSCSDESGTNMGCFYSRTRC